MITRRMLEMAAKAARYDVNFEAEVNDWYAHGHDEEGDVEAWWNPGKSDRDAFRLADALHLMIDMDERRVRVISGPLTHVAEIVYGEHDRMAINRLAIVTVAAQVGEAMVG